MAQISRRTEAGRGDSLRRRAHRITWTSIRSLSSSIFSHLLHFYFVFFSAPATPLHGCHRDRDQQVGDHSGHHPGKHLPRSDQDGRRPDKMGRFEGHHHGEHVHECSRNQGDGLTLGITAALTTLANTSNTSNAAVFNHMFALCECSQRNSSRWASIHIYLIMFKTDFED